MCTLRRLSLYRVVKIFAIILKKKKKKKKVDLRGPVGGFLVFLIHPAGT